MKPEVPRLSMIPDDGAGSEKRDIAYLFFLRPRRLRENSISGASTSMNPTCESWPMIELSRIMGSSNRLIFLLP